MKKLTFLLLLTLLASCASRDYSDIPLSTAAITNIEASEIGKPFTRGHTLKITFDYTIQGYSDIDDLYSCSINFITSEEGKSISTYYQHDHCTIDRQSGTASLSRETPLSLSPLYDKNSLKQLQLPLRYTVSIEQTIKHNRSRIIGKSEVLFLNAELP
ncbi:MAG: hypothetical protein Tsb002_02500 [Wenzhouxiangellaceae bacterium]